MKYVYHVIAYKKLDTGKRVLYEINTWVDFHREDRTALFLGLDLAEKYAASLPESTEPRIYAVIREKNEGVVVEK